VYASSCVSCVLDMIPLYLCLFLLVLFVNYEEFEGLCWIRSVACVFQQREEVLKSIEGGREEDGGVAVVMGGSSGLYLSCGGRRGYEGVGLSCGLWGFRDRQVVFAALFWRLVS
jgi:hypothetical protein